MRSFTRTLSSSVFLGLLLLAATASAKDNTWVVNDSSKAIVATITYSNFNSLAKSKFTDRIIQPGDKDHDEYTHPADVGSSPPVVNIKFYISGAPASVNTNANPDHGFVVKDAKNGGIDIYEAKYGTLHTINDSRGLLAHL